MGANRAFYIFLEMNRWERASASDRRSFPFRLNAQPNIDAAQLVFVGLAGDVL